MPYLHYTIEMSIYAMSYTHPLLAMIAAAWDVLFPGAAQASITWLPAGGLRI